MGHILQEDAKRVTSLFVFLGKVIYHQNCIVKQCFIGFCSLHEAAFISVNKMKDTFHPFFSSDLL